MVTQENFNEIVCRKSTEISRDLVFLRNGGSLPMILNCMHSSNAILQIVVI